MALQVAIDHEHLVAAGVGARPLPDLLVVLLDVLLQERPQDPERPGRDGRPARTARPSRGPHGTLRESQTLLTQQEAGACPESGGLPWATAASLPPHARLR